MTRETYRLGWLEPDDAEAVWDTYRNSITTCANMACLLGRPAARPELAKMIPGRLFEPPELAKRKQRLAVYRFVLTEDEGDADVFDIEPRPGAWQIGVQDEQPSDSI